MAAILAVSWAAAPAHAVPARPGPINVEQPDGAPLTVYLKGDEYTHWFEDDQGRLVVKAAQTKQWVYAVEVDGQVKPTALIVGRDDPSGIPEAAAAAKRIRAAAKVRRPAKVAKQASPNRASPKGTVRNLVIPVNFTDVVVQNTQQEFDALFNEIGYSADGAVGSVKDYYYEVSYGALTLQSTVVEPVTLDNTYGHYGQNDAWGDDLLPTTMVRDALAKLDARGFDFSQVDGDGDGNIDSLTVMHAGEGEEEGNDPNAIWSHMWELGNPVTYDGVIMQRYATVPAVRAGGASIIRIGVICHELGHLLGGLPDLYDRDSSSLGAGSFCVMAYGSWNGGDGVCPAHFSAWCRATLDWVKPTVISSVGAYTLSAVEATPQVYKLQLSFQANEYFLVENRQGIGFDSQLPGSSRGILIWHVDESMTDNDDETHYLVDLEEAGPDGAQHLASLESVGDDLDYFRLGNATAFRDDTNPSSLSYNDNPLGLGIENIGLTGATMAFSVVVVNPLAISGWILNADGAGIDGVLVEENSNGGWDMTDTNGYYRVPVRYGWSGTVTPTKAGYVFAPASRTYDNVREDLISQDYTGEVDPGEGTLAVQTEDEDGQPVNGDIYLDGDLMGIGSWSGDVETGTHVVSFGEVEGYNTPDPEPVTVQKDETVEVTGVYSTGAQTSTLEVTATTEPNLISVGGSALVTAQASGGMAPYSYEWDTGHKGAAFIAEPKVTKTYTVTVTDALGATGEASVVLEVAATELVVTVEADPNIVSPGQTSTLTATVSGGVEPYTYSWSTGETESTIIVAPTEPTDYFLTVEDQSGQDVTVTTTVETTQVAGVIEERGGAPCLATMAPLAIVLIAGIATLVARNAAAGRRPRRRKD